ncbi:hypothetical protein BU25DRAFT_427630 [Macroventuria anomochaeta]|uniref:Uncharacterized protein n=1 Tax=Macroventuria anomochaeta TaxID=301207 RepID=A0ACB6SEZ9_9PLEO|nr:uncharacterized protein BU25DRAFT_427630 [Macroventuria anomochaeta]KAF2632806.1 hypothetical protein BU25DRAFT_427630 [Macroventuria anomochaeta]
MVDPSPGYTRHITDPTNLHQGLKVVDISTTIFALVAVALWLFMRVHVTKNDMVMCALICSFVLLGFSFPHMSAGLGYHLWDVKWTLAGTILYATSLAFTEVSILFFYLRLAPHRWYRSLVWILLTVVVAYATAYVTVSVFGCKPIAASWDLRLAHEASCLDQYTKYMALSVLDIVIDLYRLFSVYAVLIRRTAMLAPLMASTDYTWDAVEQFKWYFAEVNLAIACASAPVRQRSVAVFASGPLH